jgi:beta-lactamase regulating signal transducer with metallopeptidase domain
MHSLTLLFDWLLATRARASLLIIVVLIVQALLGHRVPARWRYALWLPVLIVLLMPGFPESSWSVGSIIRTSPAPLPVPVLMQQGAALTATMPVVAASEMPESIPWLQVISLAWLIGAAGMVLFSFGAFVQTLWRFKHSQVPLSDALLHEVTALAREIGLRRTPRVWMASEIRSPAVTGLLHPTLLLPAHFEQTLTARDARFVLRHELTHIKRGDLPLNALLCLLLSLHWFNPLLWLAFFKARLDREAACDAQVLDREQQPERVAYGHTLLKVENAFSHHELSLGFVGIFQRGIALRSRIQSIATQPTQHPLMKTTLSLCIVLLTFLGITKAAPPDTNAPQVLIEAKFIEVSEEAKALLAPFDTAAASSSVSGMLNDVQFSTFLKKVEGAKGVDMLAAPRVTTRSAQEAKIEIGSEFAYKDAEGKAATKQIGTMLTLLPKVTGGNQIDLDISPQIVEFEGILKHASGVEQPIFRERKVTANVSMTSGQTVVLGFPATSTKQTTKDRSAGSVTTKTENVTTHTMVFVTARLVDPATGKPVDPKPAAEKSPLQAKREPSPAEVQANKIIFPKVQFQDATLTEAVEFLRIKSRELDPEKKGLNILVKPGGDPKARITIQLKDVPAYEALRYCAEIAGHKLSMDGDVFVITPKDPSPKK